MSLNNINETIPVLPAAFPSSWQTQFKTLPRRGIYLVSGIYSSYCPVYAEFNNEERNS